MLVREVAVGRTPCLVHVRRIARPGGQLAEYVAELCVIESDARVLRFVGDQEGNPVTFAHADADGALARATMYLEQRFGRLRWAPAARTEPRAVPTINDPPLRDERSSDQRRSPAMSRSRRRKNRTITGSI